MAVKRWQQIIIDLHQRAGFPSTRKVARDTDGKVSHMTVASVLNGTFPRWSSLASIAIALHARREDLNELRTHWQAENELLETARSRQRQAARLARSREVAVLRPGDTLAFILDDPELDDANGGRLQGDLQAMFPNNPVRVVNLPAQALVFRGVQAIIEKGAA